MSDICSSYRPIQTGDMIDILGVCVPKSRRSARCACRYDSLEMGKIYVVTLSGACLNGIVFRGLSWRLGIKSNDAC